VISRYERPKCAASLDVQEYEGEKNIDVEENLQPKYCPNQWNFTSEIHACKFKRGLKRASLKGQISIVWYPVIKNGNVPHR